MAACTHCSFPLEQGATFCVNCGTRLPAPAGSPGQVSAAWGGGPQPPAGQAPPTVAPTPQRTQPAPGGQRGFVPSDTGIAVCTGCGLLAPKQRDFCAVCDTRFSPTRPNAALPADQLSWVALEVRYECRSCGQSAPLNHLDVDGSVKCMHCGAEQRFDADRWKPLLAQAHALADLAGPHPEGRFPTPGVSIAAVNGYSQVGRTDTWITQESPPLRTRLAPGHPLCHSCRSPLTIAGRDAHQVTTSCPGCGATRSYELPAQARGRFAGLIGVLGAEHERGRHDVRTEMDVGGAVLVKCPNCTAPLQPSSDYSVTNCQYCGSACRITPEAMWRAGIKSLRAEWWWALFQGPSAERKRLVATRGARAAPMPVPSPAVQVQVANPGGVVRGLVVSGAIMTLATAGIGVAIFSSAASNTTSGSGDLGGVVSQLRSHHWNGTDRGVILDVNGDGVSDVIGRVRQTQPTDVVALAALDGKTGNEIWRSDDLGTYSQLLHTPLAVTPRVSVIASDQAQLFAFGTRDGKPQWQTRLTEKIDKFCQADGDEQLLVLTKDKVQHRLQLSDGSSSPLPKTDPKQTPTCKPVASDQARDDQPDAVLYAWHNQYADLVPREGIEGISAKEALHHVEQNVTIALGHKQPGSRIPMLAAYRIAIQTDDSKLTRRQQLLKRARGGVAAKGPPEVLWKVSIPGIDPLTVKEGEPDPHYVAFNDDTVVVTYETKQTHQFRLTAFSLDQGTRRWDIALPGDSPMGGVMASSTHALVSRWSGLAAFDVKTGAAAWTAGGR